MAAFWEDIKTKVSDTTNSAINKANELTEVSKLNGLINEEDKKVKNLYYQIGKAYVAKNVSNPDPELADLIAAVIESGKAIKDYKDQINAIKGIRICPNCGVEVEKTSSFCSGCGNPMPRLPEFDETKFNKCPKCGELVEKGMRFCTACGQAMEAAPAAPAAKVCGNCGATVEPDAVFCCECGTRYQG